MRKWEKFEFGRIKADERRWEIEKMRRWQRLELASRCFSSGAAAVKEEH